MKARPTNLALARPTTTRALNGTSRTARELDEGKARLVVNMTPAEHRALKIRATERGLSIRDYVLGLIRADA